MTLTPEDRLVLQARLKEAEQAYHNLMSGLSARVVVDQNAERVEFTAANRTSLYAYIMQLKGQLGLPVTGCGISPSRPALFVF